MYSCSWEGGGIYPSLSVTGGIFDLLGFMSIYDKRQTLSQFVIFFLAAVVITHEIDAVSPEEMILSEVSHPQVFLTTAYMHVLTMTYSVLGTPNVLYSLSH